MNVDLLNINSWRNPPLNGKMDLIKQQTGSKRSDFYRPSIPEKILDRLESASLERLKIFCFLLFEAFLGFLIVYLANQ
ncbi:MAG: hypothetical protein JXA42_21980 [Anaerolineales bacterium]|nr:hypothetical protein [Anaerolineales bacterium]